MKLDLSKFTVNESESNHMVVAMQYAECPISASGGICVWMVVGSGNAVRSCPHLSAGEKQLECLTAGENIT